ncbi:hypothetical protein [Sphingomonas sp. PP-CE-3A-406]|uniref:hypothetical protein n=1 Tax=Sphingomonas sp. PP-CE-3A-406 TaxID=2135659 RepID=UPI00160538D6|nr:hypothetical protein [Sphingomonas sp. PP-CE-3A-406]
MPTTVSFYLGLPRHVEQIGVQLRTFRWGIQMLVTSDPVLHDRIQRSDGLDVLIILKSAQRNGIAVVGIDHGAVRQGLPFGEQVIEQRAVLLIDVFYRRSSSRGIRAGWQVFAQLTFPRWYPSDL